MTVTLIPQVKCKYQLVNFGHSAKSLSLFSKSMNGPIRQAIMLAKNPELK